MAGQGLNLRPLGYECSSVYLALTPMLHLPLARAARSISGRPPLAWDRDSRALPQLVAAACQAGGLGGVARQLDGFVVRRARLVAAAQPAQQVGAGRVVGVIAGQLVLKTVDGAGSAALGTCGLR
jgi:hypothetical protein